MKDEIKIRLYEEDDAQALANIFYNTVHIINSKDYSKSQVDAWAPQERLETSGWKKKWQTLKPLVAIVDNTIVGFAEFEPDGHIGCFYCHHEWIGKGVGSELMRAIFNQALTNKIPRIYAEVTITAKPFFLSKGFKVVKQQTIERKGVKLTNYVMEKTLKVI